MRDVHVESTPEVWAVQRAAIGKKGRELARGPIYFLVTGLRRGSAERHGLPITRLFFT